MDQVDHSQLRRRAGRSNLTPPKAWEVGVYQIVRAGVDGLNRSLWRTKITYEAPLPSRPYILAPTHRSYIDSILVGSVTTNYMHFMAKVELWQRPAVGKFLEILGGFPVDREATDRNALRSAQKVLEWGEGLVMFPEGERRAGETIEDIHEGAAYLALKTSVPIVPVAFAGSDVAWRMGAKFPKPAKVRGVVGPAIDVADYRGSTKAISRKAIIQLTETLESELQRLYNKARSQL